MPRKRQPRRPTKETLRKFLQGAVRIRDEWLVTFMATSCVARGSIPHLTFRNLQPEYQEMFPNTPFDAFLKYLEAVEFIHVGIVGEVLPDGLTTLKGGGQGKYKGVEQHTFFTPEAKQLLMQYVRQRQQRNEALDYDSPLFVVTKKRDVKSAMQRGVALSDDAIGQIYRRIGKNNPDGTYFSPHDMRRFGRTALEKAGIHDHWIQRIMGRKVPAEKDPYSQPKIEELRSEYRTAAQDMTLQERPMIDVQKEVMKTLKSNGALDELLKPLAEKHGVSVEFLKKNLAQAGKKVKE